PNRSTSKTNALAFGIYTRLPRELRNRIYTFCVQGSYDNEVIVRRTTTAQRTTFSHLIREYCGLHAYQWIEDPVASYIDVKHVGFDVAREMLESYYWTRTLKFSHQELYLLGPFLGTDSFGLGAVPANYARRMQVLIQPFSYAVLLPEERLLEEDNCCRAIGELALAHTAMEVCLQIDLAQGSLDDADYESFLDGASHFMLQIVGVVESLKANGLRIRIKSSATWDEKDGNDMLLVSNGVDRWIAAKST
ncbi:hypothetical protein EJ02DRAFT_353223, partial [Clathrospora elynae]